MVSDNPFSGMITRESRLNMRPEDEPPIKGGEEEDMPF
jgi:hypothetical protein